MTPDPRPPTDPDRLRDEAIERVRAWVKKRDKERQDQRKRGKK